MGTQNWTISDIPDLTGKTIVVTGGNSGLGFEAIKAFALKNGHIIMACRSVNMGGEARKQILKFLPAADITVMELNLTDLESIHSFAEKFKQQYIRLDILLNNAGIMMVPYGLTKDDFENQIGTNHLGHFALTGLLLDLLKKTPKSRVVNVSSLAHKRGVMDFSNFLYENGKGYSPIKAYNRSKLCNLLFTYELQRFFDIHKIDCMSLAAHPGLSNTNLFKHTAPRWILKLFRPLFSSMLQTPSIGALPELRASVDPHAKGGEYYGPNGRRETKGYPVLVHSSAASHDQESARRLWDISEKLTHVVYN